MPLSYLSAPILIVDDEPANVLLLEDALHQDGYTQVRGVTDPREVRGFIREFKPELILLDLRMPHIDGFGILHQISEDYGEEAPHTIVLTAQANDVAKVRALALGALDFIGKPLDLDEVLYRVKNILGLKRRSRLFEERINELETILSQTSDEIQRLSLEDPGTRLPNRRGVLLHLLQVISQRNRVSVFVLQVSGIHEITFLHGYTLADKALHSVGELLTQSTIGRSNFIGYWGGNKLVLVNTEISESDMPNLAEKIIRLVSGEHLIGHNSFSLRAALGGVHAIDPTALGDEVVRRAMVSVPTEASGLSYRFYDEELEAKLKREYQIAQLLEQAVENGELSLAYQPQCRMKDRYISGAEVLVRWNSPVLGQISPAEFIPLAERTGEIIAIGTWVLETAITQLNDWIEREVVDSGFILAINLSSQQLRRGGIAAQIIAAIETCPNVSPSQIEVEVTETEMMHNFDQAREQLNIIRGAGILVALDDFGTGYSSLGYLKELPIDVVKIDQSFVASMIEDKRDRQLVETIVAMAKIFGYRLIAEGIESRDQMRLLNNMNCEYGQGYLISRPIDCEAFEQKLASVTGRYLVAVQGK